MFCRQCGAKIEDESLQKCSSCGTKLAKGRRFCQSCGKPNPHGDEFCAYCGFSFVSGPVNKKTENQNSSNNTANERAFGSTNPNPITRQQMVSDEDNINPIAKKFINQQNKEKILVSYGKKVTENPLLEKTKTLKQNQMMEAQKNEQQNKGPVNNGMPNMQRVTQQPNNQTLTNNFVENRDETPEKTNQINSNKNTDKKQEENIAVDGTHGKVKSVSEFSSLAIISFLLALATLVTCQVIYAAGAFVFSIIDLIKNKNKKPLIVSVILTAITVVAIYFGISFYII